MNKKIVIVDDEPHIRTLLLQTLQELSEKGIKILVAKNGKEGLDLIVNEKPDLVFLDVMMPEMSGYDVSKAVKSNLELSNIYIIMLTAKGQLQDRVKGALQGADEYIVKPFDPDAILKKAKEILKV
ncbi:MAG: response regulator [Nitrospirae bacterium]|nr:response regulator [Nitrospirota bacterium]